MNSPEAEPRLPTGVSYQAFESEIFGAPVWRLGLDIGAESISAAVIEARARKVALLSCRIDAASDKIRRILVERGFVEIERLVTLERPIGPIEPPANDVGRVRVTEIESTVRLAGRAFTHDRFHADGRISNRIADAIKERWVENGLRGRADAPLVVRCDGEVAGFNLCMRHGDTAVIDLIAVDERFRGRGLGRDLVRGALRHYQGWARMMRVGTQATNTASLALYRATGFEITREDCTFHWIS